MAENESLPSTAVTTESSASVAGTSALAPQSAAVKTEPPSGKLPFWLDNKWKAPWLATLGAVFGLLIGSGLHGEIFTSEQEKGNFYTFLLAAFIIGSAAYWFFDPLMELVQEWAGVPHREIPKERRFATTLAIVATTLVISVLHHSLTTSLDKVHIPGFLALLVFFGCTAGFTTYSWLRGVNRNPGRPAAFGARNGGLGGAVAGFMITSFLILYRNSTTSHSFTSADIADLAQGTGIWAGLTLLPGFLGGVAIERKWDPKSPSRGILYAMTAFSGVLFFLALLLVSLFPGRQKDLWLIAFQTISLSLGWALGLFLQRESCDRLFDPLNTTETVVPDLRTHGTMVIPIDRGRAISTSDAVAPVPLEPRPTPKELMLQPKGSRAWALGLLVIALAIGAWAYSTGAIRTDSEIVKEVVNRLQQDSSLHGKTLTAASLGRVVTVSGMVDNGAQHSAVVQQAAVVRGVKQVVDEIQLAPPPAAPVKPAAARPATTNINAQFTVLGVGGQPLAVPRPAGRAIPQHQAVRPSQAYPVPGHQAQAHPAQAPAVQQKRGGLFHLFRKIPVNNNQNRKHGR